MPRPSRLDEQRAELLPVLAQAFTELGYRRATTAELAKRCGVQVNILYRLWADKKAMFIASLDYVAAVTTERWGEMTRRASDPVAAVRGVLAYEAEHLGQFGHHRLVFTGLSETDDPEVRAALSRMYRGLQQIIERVLRSIPGRAAHFDRRLAAWALIGLGTVSTIGRELELIGAGSRKRLLAEVGAQLLEL